MPAPKHRSVNERYANSLQHSEARGETKDCAVRSVAFAANISYDEAYELMTRCGRKPGKGTTFDITEKALLELGFECINMPANSFIECYPSPHNTLKQVTTYHPRRFPGVWKDGKTYLLRCNRHILCVRDGEALDWAASRPQRVHTIMEVVPV